MSAMTTDPTTTSTTTLAAGTSSDGAVPTAEQGRALSGVAPPLLTPLTPDHRVDEASLRRLTEHLVTQGADGIFALGSSGQVAYLTDAEREQVVAAVVDQVAGRVPVLAGVIDLTAQRIVEQAARFAAVGVDQLVVTTPLYCLNDGPEVISHFERVAEGTDLPVVAYDVPVRTGTKLDPLTLVELGRRGVVTGVKDSSGNDVAFRRLVAANRAAGRPLDVLTGHEVMVDGCGLLGADGVVPGLGNVDLAGYVRLWRAVPRADWDAAAREQERLAALFEIAFVPQGRSGDAGGIGAFKEAAQQLGLIEHATMPAGLGELSDVERARIAQVLSDVELAR